MRIGIDCRTILNPGPGEHAGIGHYTYFLVRHLLKIDKQNEYVLYFDYRMMDTSEFVQPNVTIRRFPFSQYKKFLPFSYSHMLIAAYILKDRLTVYHAPANVVPLTYPGASVVTVHDLAIYHNPAWFPSQIFSTRLLVPRSLKRAKHIIAVSESTKHDLLDMFGVPARTVSVIHEAPFVSTLNVRDKNTDVLSKFRIRRPFFFFVGTIDPRKNLRHLVEAFALLRSRKDAQQTQLVIAGAKGFKHEEVLNAVARLKLGNDVRFIGYITHNEKLSLYKKSLAFVFPSLYEGFGLPVLEAMRLGVPVITSNTSSMPEVGGRAALYVDPEKPKAIARAMSRVLTNGRLRTAMVRRGYEHSRLFTWEKVAQETLKVYKKVGKGKVRRSKAAPKKAAKKSPKKASS